MEQKGDRRKVKKEQNNIQERWTKIQTIINISKNLNTAADSLQKFFKKLKGQ